jgi:hypothetical protein
VDFNCYWIPEGPGSSAAEMLQGRTAGENSIIADPRFVNPAAGDYRLAHDSPCLKLSDGAGPCGAFPAVGPDFQDTLPPEVELWAQAPAVWLPAAQPGEGPKILTAARRFPLRVWSRDAAGRPAQMSLKLGEADWTPTVPFAPQVEVSIPDPQTALLVAVRVADETGHWSEARSIRCELSEQSSAPQLVGAAEVQATARGLALAFETSEPTFATLQFGPTEAYGFSTESRTGEDKPPVRQFRTQHVLVPRAAEVAPLKHLHWRLRLESRWGVVTVTPDAVVELTGGPRTLYVAPHGRDTNPGTAEKPWRTLQYAVDRALPGDTILLQPGLYDQPTRLTHGGLPGAPIIIRAEKKWQAVLDGNRQAYAMLHLREAPYVEIHDLEIRWYGYVGISVDHSPNVAVHGCKIWNDFWYGWPTGRAISVVFSPNFSGEGNVLFRQESGFWLYQSPGARIVQNTCLSNLYGAAHFYYSVRGSVCKNNDFAFQGNDVLVIEVEKGRKADLNEFKCDYNNLGTMLREQPPGTIFDSVTPREAVLHGYSKAIVGYTEYGGEGLTRLQSLAKWRAFSGQDQHSIVADPLHRSVVRQQFELDPHSPNLGAGENGATLGAFGPAVPEPARGPLRIHPTNPRYFTDSRRKAIYLTGSHTWGNLCDYPPTRWPPFDYPAYLEFLDRYHHNFIRLWAGDSLECQPCRYVRTGPGPATDGEPRIDLTRLNPEYFDRLRARVVAARDRGIYVGVMLFGSDACKREDWPGHLFNPANNVQGLNGDTNGDGFGAEAYDLSVPEITRLQETFVRKVVDTVNDLDNVLYEIGNEGDLSSVNWQYHFIRFIRVHSQ